MSIIEILVDGPSILATRLAICFHPVNPPSHPRLLLLPRLADRPWHSHNYLFVNWRSLVWNQLMGPKTLKNWNSRPNKRVNCFVDFFWAPHVKSTWCTWYKHMKLHAESMDKNRGNTHILPSKLEARGRDSSSCVFLRHVGWHHSLD